MKVERLNEFTNSKAHYEDTIDKDVLSSAEADTLRMPIYRFGKGENDFTLG